MANTELPAESDKAVDKDAGAPLKLCRHYTYFILPFGYRLQRAASEGDSQSYLRDCCCGTTVDPFDWAKGEEHVETRRTTADRWEARLRYLLPETRLTLFERAHWFHLPPPGCETETLLDGTLTPEKRGNKPIAFRIGGPRLVLFEWESAMARADAGPGEPAQVGLLLVPAIVVGDEPQDLGDLLDFNLLMRYVARPTYADYRSGISLSGIKGCAWAHAADVDERYNLMWRLLAEERLLREAAKAPPYKLLIDPPLGPSMASQHAKDRKIGPVLVGTERSPGEQDPDRGAGYPDDRTFVYTLASVANLPAFADRRNLDFEEAQAVGLASAWYALLDGDGRGDLGKRRSQYELRWLTDHSYGRWASAGTVYGYTNFSAAMLTRNEQAFFLTFDHFRDMYLDQLLLMLYLRAALFRFSYAISRYSADYRTDVEGRGHERKRTLENFRRLRREFTMFTNLYQFPMLSAQYQGQEMYDLARRSLDIDRIYREVEAEVKATDEFLAQEDQDDLSVGLRRIQYGGAAVAVLAVLLAAQQVILADQGGGGAETAGGLAGAVAGSIRSVRLVASLAAGLRWAGVDAGLMLRGLVTAVVTVLTLGMLALVIWAARRVVSRWPWVAMFRWGRARTHQGPRS